MRAVSDRLAQLATAADKLRRQIERIERQREGWWRERELERLRAELQACQDEWRRLVRESLAEDGGPRTPADANAETEDTGLWPGSRLATRRWLGRGPRS